MIIAIYFISSFYSKYQSFLKTETVKIDKDLTVVLGGGGNSGILNTDSAVVVIDTKMKDPAKALYSFAKSIAGNKKIIDINTHYHPDELQMGISIIKAAKYMQVAMIWTF